MYHVARPSSFPEGVKQINKLLERFDMEVSISSDDMGLLVSFVRINFVAVDILAEHLNYEQVQPKEVLAIFDQVMDLIDKNKYGCFTARLLQEWLDELSGEMAYLLAFPRKGPYWRVYNLGDQE